MVHIKKNLNNNKQTSNSMSWRSVIYKKSKAFHMQLTRLKF